MAFAAAVQTNQALFISGNEAVALAARDAGCKVASAYPGTPSTEILEYISGYPNLYSEWSINEKVSLEVAIGASLAGSRALCLWHVRKIRCAIFSESCLLNKVEHGDDHKVGFITSGAAYCHVREAFPNAPILKLGLSHPAPIDMIREFADSVEKLVVIKEVEPLLETELKAAGITLYGLALANSHLASLRRP